MVMQDITVRIKQLLFNGLSNTSIRRYGKYRLIKGECYAICEKENNIAIGAIELKLNGHTDMTERDDECELGYWLGKPFWGRGYMPEAARELIRYGFEDLGMTTIWCGYYDGNSKSKRVQEKVGFLYHHTRDEVPVSLMNEVRIGHTNYMTKERWLKELK